MEILRSSPSEALSGTVCVPGDKSISHRAVILGSIAKGNTSVTNFSDCEDCQRTILAFRKMGVNITKKGSRLLIEGAGLKGLREPASSLYLGNSGTSMRLLMGILAGQRFRARLTGDESLSKRPMARVAVPLRQMGAEILGKNGGNLAPLTVRGTDLKPIEYRSPVASAQVKSAVLLAGLYAKGRTTVVEPYASRDHTERMLRAFGSSVCASRNRITVTGGQLVSPGEMAVPGDISAAAFLLVAACIAPGSRLTVTSVGVNPTRNGIITYLGKMGAKITVGNRRLACGEPVADVTAEYSNLKGVRIPAKAVPALIDEIPVLMVAASLASGRTVIEDISELRVKETDRADSMTKNLARMGAKARVSGKAMIIDGVKALRGCRAESYKDHRTAMSMLVAGLVARGTTVVKDTACIATSFPGFVETFNSIGAAIRR